jgi:hypothetical protein
MGCTCERIVTILLLLWHLNDVLHVESFIVTNINSRLTKTPSGPTKSAVTVATLHAQSERLTFAVDIIATSDPIGNVTIDDLGKFLSTTTCRDVFLSAGGKTQCNEVTISSEMEQMWKTECLSHYGPEMLPESGDSLVKSESTIQFPGLKMVNEVYSGVKARSKKDNTPCYDIILVAERKRVVGAPPIVWLFNKLTGHSEEKENAIQSPSAKVQSVVSVLDNELGPCFCFDCNAEIVVELPKAVMKFLPASKEKMEEQGTASIKKAIEKDIQNALDSVNEVYFHWVKTLETNMV